MTSHLVESLIPVAGTLHVSCKALSSWKILCPVRSVGVRAPAKWNTPSGFQWVHSDSPPGCWRGTRGHLQVELLWLPGFYTSLSCCRWIWPSSPVQPQWQKSQRRSPLKTQKMAIASKLHAWTKIKLQNFTSFNQYFVLKVSLWSQQKTVQCQTVLLNFSHN